MHIRFGITAERRALEELQRRASLALEEYREALLAHPDAIDLPEEHLRDLRVRVAEDDGAILGFSVLLTVNEGLELDGLFVEPVLWAKGIGRALMKEVLDTARQAHARIGVVASPQAQGFYAKFGFVPVGAEPTRFGPAVRMTRAASA